MNREERIKNKIVKLHAKYKKTKDNPGKFNTYWFIPLVFVLGVGMSYFGNFFIFRHFITSMISAVAATGLTAAAIYKYSSDFHDTRVDRLLNKILRLEYVLSDKYGLDKDGNILCVPDDKVRDYLDGKYILSKSYYVEHEDMFAYLTTQEIEDLRSKGFEFHKNMDRLKALSPDQVKDLVSKGYTITRDGVETFFTKDGEKLQLDRNRASSIFPSYDMKLSKFQQRDKENLIARMTTKDVVVEKGAKKDEIIDHETGIDLNLD